MSEFDFIQQTSEEHRRHTSTHALPLSEEERAFLKREFGYVADGKDASLGKFLQRVRLERGLIETARIQDKNVFGL